MFTGNLIDELTEIVAKHEARLKANPPTEQEWRSFLTCLPCGCGAGQWCDYCGLYSERLANED